MLRSPFVTLMELPPNVILGPPAALEIDVMPVRSPITSNVTLPSGAVRAFVFVPSMKFKPSDNLTVRVLPPFCLYVNGI